MSDETSTLHKALLTIRKLKKTLQEQSSKKYSPIAIIGLSCRFPQAHNQQQFWQLLTQGKTNITHIPSERWSMLAGTSEIALKDPNHPYWGGYLPDIDKFDAYFFGISAREAMRMDPQQRLFLEVAFEAIRDANLSKDTLKGTNTGVFASLYANQLGYLQKLHDDLDALYIPTGSAISIAANRLSYFLDIHGPSLVLDTACSSSLVAAHLACLHLNQGLCDLAIVGGVNINLMPSINLLLAKAKMLSPEGRCKTFAAEANGYVQGEGAGAIILKPLARALKDEDHIYALISGSAVNQDGKTNGLTAPNGLSQEELLTAAYHQAQINPADISYLECHGTGTTLGDSIELQALANILSKNRNDNEPCFLGSVKTNIGHLEPAAGIASIIKIALSLKYSQIPPHSVITHYNPMIDFKKSKLSITQQPIEWPKYGDYRLAGISGFGFGGTNAHLVLQEAIDGQKNNYQFQPSSWQHKSYWPPLHTNLAQSPAKTHIFHGKILPSPLEVLQYEFKFDPQELGLLKDTYNLLHVGYYVEMIAFAIEQTYQQKSFSINSMLFKSPIIISEDKTRIVLHLTPTQKIKLCFYSQMDNHTWKEHLTAEIDLATAPRQLPISIKALDPEDKQPGTKFYERISAMSMPSAGSICWVDAFWQYKNFIICALKAPEGTQTTSLMNLPLHFSAIEACMQGIFLSLPEKITSSYITSEIHHLSFHDHEYKTLYLVAELKSVEDTTLICDWYLSNDNEEVIGFAEKIHLKPLSQHRIINNITTQFANKIELTAYLSKKIAELLSMPPSDLNPQKSLSSLGLDSLMALVLIKILEPLDKTIKLDYILQGPTIEDLVDKIMHNPWINYRQPQINAKIKLFCFPHGGAGAAVYRNWQQLFPNTIEICPIQFPGRENRATENAILHINQLVEQLILHLKPEFNLSFAFFGHSLGALVSFELARELSKQNLPLPQHLFLSAFPDPKNPRNGLNKLLTRLAQEKLDLLDLATNSNLDRLTELELLTLTRIFADFGITDLQAAKMSPELLKWILPIFAQDMQVINNYTFYNSTPLTVPFTILSAKRDQWITEDELKPWANYTTKCIYEEYEGDHLFIQQPDVRQEVVKNIVNVLCTVRFLKPSLRGA